MTDDATNESNDKGKEDNKPVETSKKPDKKPEEPLSLYDKTEKVVAEDKANLKKREELIKREETLLANQRLAGTTGGNVVIKPKEETPKEYNDRIEKEIGEGKHDD